MGVFFWHAIANAKYFGYRQFSVFLFSLVSVVFCFFWVSVLSFSMQGCLRPFRKVAKALVFCIPGIFVNRAYARFGAATSGTKTSRSQSVRAHAPEREVFDFDFLLCLFGAFPFYRFSWFCCFCGFALKAKQRRCAIKCIQVKTGLAGKAPKTTTIFQQNLLHGQLCAVWPALAIP